MAVVPRYNKISEYIIFLAMLSMAILFSSNLYASPQIGTVTPSDGSSKPNTQVNFTTTYYSGLSSYKDIQYAYLLVSNSSENLGSFLVYYDQPANKLYIRNAGNTSSVGGYAPGSLNVINSYFGSIDCSRTIVSGSGRVLTINWAVTFFPPSENYYVKNIYLWVNDKDSSISGWVKKGTWLIGENPALYPASLSPTNGSSIPDKPVTLKAVYYNLNGYQNIKSAGILINDPSNTKNCFHALYDRANNKVYLRNDTDTAWLGGSSPGSYNIIQNKTAKLDCSKTKVLSQGKSLTVDWNITFKPAFIGYKQISLSAVDNSNASKGWLALGSWSIQKEDMLPGSTFVSAQYGGTVASYDGKVKVVMPPLALLQDTSIKVTCPDPKTYQTAAPNSYSLYLIADCKPNNIIFYKPVQLIFTLDSPQVPGTPVYLGLYNERDGKIELEEFSSFVAVDSVTVTFLINHFSTYAAMQGMLSQGSAIGASTKTPLPDLFTGSFSHSIPIIAPPGRKGIQPNLSLQYRSSNSNSSTGVGWVLNTGYITRQAKKGLPKYDDSDIFTFVSDSFATELVHLIDNLYQAKIEGSFMKFFKLADDSWKVVSKDGSYILFGTNSTSKEIGLNNATYNWYITKAVDNNSNYITYDYIKDQGKCYLSKVEYTGNEAAHVSAKYRIDFYLSDRDDTQSSYISGEKITTAKRLDKIEVYFDGVLVWKYQLDYVYSLDTGRSLLESFTQYTSDGKEFPAQTFTYQKSK